MTAPLKTLSVANLSVRFGRQAVLCGATLGDLRPGAVTVLAGPNGAGKSTLLRAVAGLVPATGHVRWGGRDLLAASVAERAAILGFMPQSIAATAGLTVLESVIASVRGQHGRPAQGGARDRALAALDRVGIVDLAMKPLSRLSGGQRQLASLAQSLVREPDILLLDEPTSALDLHHQHAVMSTLRDLARQGRLVVVVQHDLALATTWADHLVFLHDGGIAAEGAPADVLTGPLLESVYGVRASMVRDADAAAHLVVHGLSPQRARDLR